MRFRAACLVVLAVSLATAGGARADADPASDVLYVRPLFLPYGNKVSKPAEQELRAAIARSVAAGKEIRVALISSPNDLGGVPQLFGSPSDYARFLGGELQFVYAGRLLVVMPQGAGYSRGGKLIADRAVLDARPADGGDGLAKTATELVQVLSGAKPAAASSGGGSSSTGTVVILVVVLVVVALVVVALVVVLRARRK